MKHAMNLGRQFHVHGAKVFDKDFPLRFGPDKLRDESQDDFNGFMDDFTYQLYGSVIDDADIATRTQDTTYLPGDEDRDPTLEVEAITDKIGKGNKVKYLVKWRGYAKKTWEPPKYLKGAMGAVQTFEKTLTAAGRKLAAATAISSLSAKSCSPRQRSETCRGFPLGTINRRALDAPHAFSITLDYKRPSTPVCS